MTYYNDKSFFKAAQRWNSAILIKEQRVEKKDHTQ